MNNDSDRGQDPSAAGQDTVAAPLVDTTEERGDKDFHKARVAEAAVKVAGLSSSLNERLGHR